METIEEILERRAAEGFQLRLEPAPAGWRCLVREAGRGWTSLRAGHEGFTTALEAVMDVDARIGGLQSARQESSAVVTLERLQLAVTEERLRKKVVDGPLGPEVRWVVRKRGGGETAETSSPVAAVRAEQEEDAAGGR
jgi:hypothetical protein